MIQGKLLSYGDDLSEVFRIRRTVFVEELGIPEKEEFDEFDQDAIHVLVYEEPSIKDKNILQTPEKIPVATGRIVYEDGNCKIGHIAVLKNYRNKEYGDFAVRMLINRAFIAGINEVSLLTDKKNVGFFSKIGFKITEKVKSINDSNNVDMIIHDIDIKKACR